MNFLGMSEIFWKIIILKFKENLAIQLNILNYTEKFHAFIILCMTVKNMLNNVSNSKIIFFLSIQVNVERNILFERNAGKARTGSLNIHISYLANNEKEIFYFNEYAVQNKQMQMHFKV